MKFVSILLAAVMLFVSGCSGFLQPTPESEPTASPTAEILQPTVPFTPEAGVTSTPGPVTLRVWVPPQFDPNADTPAGRLLKDRLQSFTTRRPGVKVEVRVKAEDGPGGLLDTLTTASAAAPLALPDLVALPRPLMETAALKGLLHPYNGQTTVMDDPDWYGYAQELAKIQNSVFGLPFAGDAQLLVYRPVTVPTPPADWEALLQTPGPIVFAAADPQALFTLTQYQAAGGDVSDDQGRPSLNPQTLEEVLRLYDEAEAAGLMPYWLTQYQNDDQVWEAFNENPSNMVVTWTSRFLGEMQADTAAAPQPTIDGEPYTLATGWVWALAGNQPQQQTLAVQLAEYLTESSFLARWTEAAGYLPPRPSALAAWTNTSMQGLLEQVVDSAHLSPPADALVILGPPLAQATVEVLKQQTEPVIAAQEAVNALTGP